MPSPIKRWKVSFIVEDSSSLNEYEIERAVLNRDPTDHSLIINNIEIEELPDGQ